MCSLGSSVYVHSRTSEQDSDHLPVLALDRLHEHRVPVAVPVLPPHLRLFRQQPEAVNIAHSYGTLGECHPDVGLYFEVNVVTA